MAMSTIRMSAKGRTPQIAWMLLRVAEPTRVEMPSEIDKPIFLASLKDNLNINATTPAETGLGWVHLKSLSSPQHSIHPQVLPTATADS